MWCHFTQQRFFVIHAGNGLVMAVTVRQDPLWKLWRRVFGAMLSQEVREGK